MNSSIKAEKESDVIYFYGEKNRYGCFSQFYKCKFIADNPDLQDYRMQYNCCEQYMMYKKSLLFNDEKIALQILKETEPKKIKKLGRMIKNFNEDIWNENKELLVEMGNYLKFSQNKILRDQLLQTGVSELVEASPYDKIWGIGISCKDAINGKPRNGQNLLGIQLMKVRERLYIKSL